MLRKSFFLLLAGLMCIGNGVRAQTDTVEKVRVQLLRRSARRTFNGQVVNPSGQTLEVATLPAVFTGVFINHGIFKSTNTVVAFRRAYTELGSYVSDPSTNYFTDLIVGTGGTLTGGTGDLFVVSGNFYNSSLQNTTWNTASAELDFSSGTVHAMSLAGSDMGASSLGYVNNFAWGTLRLSAGQSLVLSDGNGTAGAAFYADGLILDGGVAQIASITGNGFNIYYDPYNSANAYLGGMTYSLSGGGAIIPIAAVLKITAITRLSNAQIVLQCLGFPNHSHTIKFSPDLIVPFAFMGSATAAPDGTFQFTDANAGSYSKRFYQITFP